MEIILPDNFKDLSMLGMQELILNHNYGITSHSIKEAKILFEYLCNFYQDEYLKSLEMVTPKHILERKN